MIKTAKTIMTFLQDLPIKTDYFIVLLEAVIRDKSVLIAKHFCEVLLNRANREKDEKIAEQLHFFVRHFSKVVAKEMGKLDPNESEGINCIPQD